MNFIEYIYMIIVNNGGKNCKIEISTKLKTNEHNRKTANPKNKFRLAVLTLILCFELFKKLTGSGFLNVFQK